MLRAVTVLLAAAIAGCATSPTGRGQLKLVPEAELAEMGAEAYGRMKAEGKVSRDPKARRLVRCVADAIVAASGSRAEWEVTVFEDDSVNAFALPGGYIGVNTGLLGVAENADQLAAVLGHEVAHVLADHPNARVSAQYATAAGVGLVQAIAGAASDQRSQLLGLLGVGAQYGIVMPYARGQETEADVLGQRLMADAGFDPRESIELWRNMAREGGRRPPAFLSTHPAPEARIATLGERMPEARERYRRARDAGRRPGC